MFARIRQIIPVKFAVFCRSFFLVLVKFAVFRRCNITIFSQCQVVLNLRNKVSDIEYELVDSDIYVYPTARKVAEDIIKEWSRPGGNLMFVLKAPMQDLCYALSATF
jgi:hypothetical protein